MEWEALKMIDFIHKIVKILQFFRQSIAFIVFLIAIPKDIIYTRDCLTILYVCHFHNHSSENESELI